jgi:multisubunit Na+/H+ antiporter MnhB subunit
VSPTLNTLLVALLAFMIIAGVAAIHMRSLLSAVIAMGALGFAANVAFLALGAPDVAIVLAVVEVLVLVVLIRATLGRDVETTAEVRDTFGLAFAIVLLAVFAVFAIMAAQKVPELGSAGMVANADAPSRTDYLPRGLEETGAASAVAAVLLDYRGYDTLGEATVLFTSIVGAIALLRRRAKRAEGTGSP